MELKICGTEYELAAFLMALGKTNNKVWDINIDTEVPNVDSKKKTVSKKGTTKKQKKAIVKTGLVNTKYLSNKYNLTEQAIRNYIKLGMPHQLVNNKYVYDEVETCKWIDDYMSTHKCANRGTKYKARTRTNIKVDENTYSKWKNELFKMCREKGKDEGKMLSLVFKYMTKNYGVVWDQVKKDFYKANGYYPQSTTRMAYWLEANNNTYHNLTSSCLYTILKEA